jgi:hypothetical protein
LVIDLCHGLWHLWRTGFRIVFHVKGRDYNWAGFDAH